MTVTLRKGGTGWPIFLLPYRLYQRWAQYLTYKHYTFLLLSVLVTEQLTGLQLQTMGTGNSWFTVFSGLGVIGLASLCAICIPSAHPSSKVQYVGLQSSVSLAGWPLSHLRNYPPTVLDVLLSAT